MTAQTFDQLPDRVRAAFPDAKIREREFDEAWGGMPGYHIDLPNGWRVSVIFGGGSHTTIGQQATHPDFIPADAKPPYHGNRNWAAEQTEGEIAAWRLDVGRDYVFDDGLLSRGYQSFDAVMAFIKGLAEHSGVIESD